MNYAKIHRKLIARAEAARAAGAWASAARAEDVARRVVFHVFFSNQWSAFEREAIERGRRLEDSGWCCADY